MFVGHASLLTEGGLLMVRARAVRWLRRRCCSRLALNGTVLLCSL